MTDPQMLAAFLTELRAGLDRAEAKGSDLDEVLTQIMRACATFAVLREGPAPVLARVDALRTQLVAMNAAIAEAAPVAGSA